MSVEALTNKFNSLLKAVEKHLDEAEAKLTPEANGQLFTEDEAFKLLSKVSTETGIPVVGCLFGAVSYCALARPDKYGLSTNGLVVVEQSNPDTYKQIINNDLLTDMDASFKADLDLP